MNHAPKQRALEAYAEELLSPPARKRVEAHLSLCSCCRECLGAIRAYALLREQAAAELAPELSWERLERALDAPRGRNIAPAPRGREPSRNGRVVALVWPLLAVAATLVVAWLGVSGSPDAPPPTQQRAERPHVQASELAMIGRVTLIAGAARLERGDLGWPIDLNSEIREGSLLITERNAELHVALGAETGFVLGPESRLRVLELRAGRTRLELVVGRLANRVKKFAMDARPGETLAAVPAEQYQVLAGDITASVRGTRFSVEHAQATRIFVQEGLVEVTRGNTSLALLAPGQSYEAPARKRSAAPARDVTIHELERAFGGLHALHLPPVPELRNWRIDGATLSAQGTLSMRMPPGPARFTFEDVRGQVRSVEIDVSEPETRIDPLWLSKLVAPKEAPRTGRLEPEQIAKVIKAGLEPLRRCYERSLRTAPALEARLTLAVRIGPDGRVQRADANAASELPPELERCIAGEAGRLLFPKPEGGGSMVFEVPLNLKAK